MPSASRPVLAVSSACAVIATASTALRAFTVAPASYNPSSPAQLRGTGALEGSTETSVQEGAQLPFVAGAAALVAAAGLSSKSRTKVNSRAAKASCRAVSVGTEVVWNGKEGTVRYVGSTKFASGEWVGVELKSTGGMHNGTVMGVSYFECPEGCGVFAQPEQLLGGAPAPAAAPAAPAAPAAAPVAAAVASPAAAVAVGATVSFNGNGRPPFRALGPWTFPSLFPMLRSNSKQGKHPTMDINFVARTLLTGGPHAPQTTGLYGTERGDAKELKRKEIEYKARERAERLARECAEENVVDDAVVRRRSTDTRRFLLKL